MKYTINKMRTSRRKGLIEIELLGTYDVFEGLSCPYTGQKYPTEMRNYKTTIEVEESAARGYTPGDEISVDIAIEPAK